MSEGRFLANEKVLAFHGPLIYEAKILRLSSGHAKSSDATNTAKAKDKGAKPGDETSATTQKEESGQKTGSLKYFIHYHGWNKNWDEWVAEPRILKYTESNLERKKELIKAHEASVKAKKAAAHSSVAAASTAAAAAGTAAANASAAGQKRKATSEAAGETVSAASPAPSSHSDTSKSPKVDRSLVVSLDRKLPDVCQTAAAVTATAAPQAAPSSSKKKAACTEEPGAAAGTDQVPPERPQDNTVETEDQFNTKVEIIIRVPDELKPYLVDDWDYLSRQRKLVTLPARQTVDGIIQDYIKYKSVSAKRTPGNGRESAVQEVTSGLREYFNVMLGSQLLYKFEREQHSDMIKQFPDTPMSEIYGAIHFLRLFVKLGAMLTYTPLDEKSVQLLLHYINDFLGFMKKNASTLFTIADYGTAPPEYHRRAL